MTAPHSGLKKHRTPLLITTLVAALAIPPALAATVEERLGQLETQLETIAAENAALRQKLGEAAPVFVTASGKEKSLAIGGYIQVQGEAGDAPDSRFPEEDRLLVRRARLTVKGSFAENIDFVFQSEFGNGNLGTTANYRAQLTDLYLRWTRHDFAHVTVGQFKTPFGYEQLVSDTKTLFIERSLPNDRLTLSRQIGAMVSGDIVEDRLDYAVGLFNGNGVNRGGNDNDQFTYVGRLAGTVYESEKIRLTAGANAFAADTATSGGAAGERDGLGLDVQVRAGRLDLGAEWLRAESAPDTGADSTADGWSAHVAWQLVPKKFQLLTRFETYDPNTSVAGDDGEVWTVGCNYFVKGDDIKLSLNYLLGDPAGAEDDQGRLLARAQIIF